MGIWSEVDFSEVARSTRFDAEYFQPKFLRYDAIAREFGGNLSEFVPRIVQPTEFIREYVDFGEGMKFWRAQNVRRGYVDIENVEYIEYETFESVKNAHVKEGDVLVTRTGANAGDCAVVPSGTAGVAVSSHTLRLIPKSLELGYAIGGFFASDFGRDILFRSVSGSSRPQITKEMLNALLLPDFSRIAGEMTDIIRAAYSKRDESKAIYIEAEALLLDALGLNDLDATHAITYEANFKEAARAGRFDAQFFSPRAQGALKIMGQSGKTLGDVAPLARRPFKPQVGEEFRYIEIGDLGGDGRAESSHVAGEDAPSRAQNIVRPRDVITSTVRPIRRLSALIEPEQDGFVCSSGFAVLEPKSVEPEVLLIYLRSPIVSEILDLHTTATMYPAVATDVLMDIPFSAPTQGVSDEIVAKVRASRVARDEAQNLLERAKARVEELIEGSA